MPLKPLFTQTPAWYATGKAFLQDTLKDPARIFNVAGVHNRQQTTQRFALRNTIFKEAVTLGTTSDTLFIPAREGNQVVVRAIPGATGTAKVEWTLSPIDEVLSGTADWVVWVAGAGGVVSADTTVTISHPVSALRMTAATADAEWEVLVLS